MKKLILFVTIISVFATFAFSQKKMKRTPDQLRLEATYARPDGKDFVFSIRGSAYAFIPGERPFKLFGVDGFNIRRRVETPEKDGFFLATRELVFYTDPKTGEIIDEWESPWTKEKAEVFHIANNPVNGRTRVKDGKYISVSMDGKREFGETDSAEESGDYLIWHTDVFPFYPLPNFDKNYTAAELFDFYVPKKYLYNNEIPKNVYVSWTRVGPWLPWMKMDGKPGIIVYHARSERLENWNLLPEKVKARTKKDFPIYMTAPDKVDPNGRNETSWTYYNRIIEERKKKN